MGNFSCWKKGCALLLLCAVMAIASPAQIFTTLQSFGGTNGALPTTSLIQGVNGNFYGTTQSGGTFTSSECSEGCGTVFEIAQSGMLKSLHSFDLVDGADPDSGLVQGADGNFYGTSYAGGTAAECSGPLGCGTVFKITPGGKVTTLYSFCSRYDCPDGLAPIAELVQSTDGNFYGTTVAGGANGQGTIFKITPAGELTTLYSFCAQGFPCTDGAQPAAVLVQGTNRNYYGTTTAGGTGAFSGCAPYNCGGTVFEITPSGKLTTLYSFCSQMNCTDGEEPTTGLVQGSDSNYYGTTYFGGTDQCSSGCGTIFKVTPGGKLTILHRFDVTDGAGPVGLMRGSDGNFYGTTYSGGADNNPNCNSGQCGTVFEITAAGLLNTLHSFCSQPTCTDGSNPTAALMQATNGTIYGTTGYGGTNLCGNLGCGTVFSLSTGLGPFVIFVRAAGKVGQTGPILGQGFTGTTSVSLNGIPASFTVVSDTYIRATVPAGATTGYVTVTMPSGTLTSNVPFHVIK
jgi:uncharacterized repeat protein (TIGR03803 family)